MSELAALVATINKRFGANTLICATDLARAGRFTTGSLSLDIALGGGWPANQWSEIIGNESSGKTTLVHKTVAANQAADPDFATLWVAAEPYDEAWARALGVDLTRVMLYPTRAMEEAYSVMLEAAESRAVDAVILDSYPALVPDAEDQKDMDENTVSSGARVTNKFFRKAGKATARCVDGTERPMLGLIINQWRSKIGAFSPTGDARTTPGGRGKDFAYVVRLDVARAEYIDEDLPGKGAVRVGQVIKARTLKNKSAPPHRVATMDFYFQDTPSGLFRQGDYDLVKELVTMGV
jgi:recombination protein RecA